MSTAAENMVERIKSERIKKETKLPPSDPYVKLLIDKGLRRGLLFVFLIALVIVTVLVAKNLLSAADWRQLILPVLAVGGPLALFPKTEKWAYEPWQSRSRKYERTLKN